MHRGAVLGLAALAASVVGAADTVKCGNGSKCPQNLPCCSQYGQCGVGAYCLGGCDPFNSNSRESCVPAPVCKSQEFKLNSLDGIESNTKYLGDPSKTNWVSSGQPVAYQDSLLLTMAPDTVGTLLASSTYMWYGRVSATLKSSRGKGVVTAFILLSDVKDEIDYEFIGTDLDTAQTNYYYQGVTNYDNGMNISLSDTFQNYHTYTIDWTPEQITWSIDGQVGRTKKRSETYNKTTNRYEYPQSPARVQLSLWPGGLPTNGEGTINWAGGLVDWNAQDIQSNGYYYASVKEVKMECYDPPSNARKSGSKSYVWTKDGGTEDAVEITDKQTVLKSLLGSGTNMSADYPSARSSSSSASATGSRTSSAGPEATSDVATVPGMTGAGPGTNGQRGGGGGSESNGGGSNSGSNSNSNSGGSGGSGASSSSSSAAAQGTGFSQGGSSTNQNANGASGHGEQVLRGSVFAGLVAVAGVVLL